MTLVAADGLGDRTGEDRVKALLALALVCGIFQLAMGLLGLGFLTRFVSNAVMTGFLTGIAVLIILGQLWDLTGFDGEGGSKLEQTSELILNLGQIDFATTIIGIGALVLMFWLERTKLASFNLLIALAIALAGAWLLGKAGNDSIALVSSLGDIPRSPASPPASSGCFRPLALHSGFPTRTVAIRTTRATSWPRAPATSRPASSRGCRAVGHSPVRRSIPPPGDAIAGASSSRRPS
jgi:MFS superfamily sulfate permease-like transporter